MKAVRAAAAGCALTEARRIPGDTVVVVLTDSTLTQARWEAMTWTLCGGYGNQVNSREVSNAILGPLWEAWPTLPPLKTATLVVNASAPGEIKMRLSFPAPDAPR